MSFIHTRMVRFQETDAAGVVYFANLLSMCHEAYEVSLVASKIDLKAFFTRSEVAVPIVHARVDFFKPIFCGDRLVIDLTPRQLSDCQFEVDYRIDRSVSESEPSEESGMDAGASLTPVAKAMTRHMCIDPIQRQRQGISAEMTRWLSQWAEPLVDEGGRA